MTEPAQSSPWWAPFYDDLLATVLLEQTGDDEVDQTIDFLVRRLDLVPGARVFDQCCGTGRLSLPLARRGFSVVGVDQAASYVEEARAEAEAAGLEAAFHVGDAFAFVPDGPCEAAINWWTSFGYAADDATNARMFERAFEALAPGGGFALDVFNLAAVLKGSKTDAVVRRSTPEGDIVLERESRVDVAAGTLHKRWIYTLPDGRQVVRESRVRMYLPHTIADMLRGCGFVDVALYGGVDGRPITVDSPRCVAVARRPRP